MKTDWEVRSRTGLKQHAEGESRKIAGHWSVFNVLTELIDGWYKEMVRAGAFLESLNSGSTIKCLYQHNPENVLGSTKSGTLTLREDGIGLYGECIPPKHGLGLQITESMDRGDIDEASIGFYYRATKWLMGSDYDVIEVLSADLRECSVANFPRNHSAQLSLRSALPAEIAERSLVARALNRYQHDKDLVPNDDDKHVLMQYRSLLSTALPPDRQELLKRALPPQTEIISIPSADSINAWLDVLALEP